MLNKTCNQSTYHGDGDIHGYFNCCAIHGGGDDNSPVVLEEPRVAAEKTIQVCMDACMNMRMHACVDVKER